MSANLILFAIAALAVQVGFLYVAPFGRCGKCKGTGHIQRGPGRRPVCPRCKGRRRVQHRGSRTVHQLARRIRHGRQAAARYQQRDSMNEGD